MTYEIVRELGSENKPNVQRESTLVKIDPTLCRGEKSFDLYEIDHVIVEALRITNEGRVYEETHVVASDDSATVHPAILYTATRALTVEEALFAIGEHNFTEHPNGDFIDPRNTSGLDNPEGTK